MLDFNFKNDSKVIFGKNSLKQLKAELEKYNVRRMLVISSGDFIKDLGIFSEVEDACNKLNIEYIYNNKVVPNPRIELVDELVAVCKKEKIDFVLAIGGGSTMDTAKAVAVGAKSNIPTWEFYLYNEEPKEALNIGVISTLPSSGSESSNCSIISSSDKKLGIEYDFIIPRFAIINPEYTRSLPMFQLAAGICDTSSHLIERYLTNEENVDTTDYMIEGLLKALIVNAKRLFKNPENLAARSEIFLISIFAHNNILDSGRMADWASHRIEHELSNEYGITHGEGMALVMVAYTKYMSKKSPKKLAQLASRVFGVDSFNHSDEEMALILSEKLDEFYKGLNMRTRLNLFGIDNSKFEKMSLTATKNNSSKVGHYLPLNSSEIIKVYELAL